MGRLRSRLAIVGAVVLVSSGVLLDGGTYGASPVAAAPVSTTPYLRSVQARDAEEAAAADVVSMVNRERARTGCRPVKRDAVLGLLATALSEDMAVRGFFDHTDPDGRAPWDRWAEAGAQGFGGENIARGPVDAKAVMDAWMESPGHRANILNCEYRIVGVGVYFGQGGPWWTQDFGY